ncbi:MAG: helix-turn-helix domain-containing protein [Bacillota bacterium]|nr:helix-turn-helix domain-containing protein [Bacillota bacterium]
MDLTKAFLQKQLESGATLLVEDPADLHGYTQLPNAILCNPNLRTVAVRVYGIIRSCLRPGRPAAWPGQARIAAMAGVTRETVNRTLAELKKLELIDWCRRGRGRTNIYVLKRIPAKIVAEYEEFLASLDGDAGIEDQGAPRGAENPAKPCHANDVTAGSHQEGIDVTPESHQEKTPARCDARITSGCDLRSQKEDEVEEDNVVVVSARMRARASEPRRHQHQGDICPNPVVLPRSPRGGTNQGGKDPGAACRVTPPDVSVAARALCETVPELGGDEARELLMDLVREHSVDAVLAKIHMLARAGEVVNVGGWLRRALDEDWKCVPKPGRAAQNRRKDHRTRRAELGDKAGGRHRHGSLRDLYV